MTATAFWTSTVGTIKKANNWEEKNDCFFIKFIHKNQRCHIDEVTSSFPENKTMKHFALIAQIGLVQLQIQE